MNAALNPINELITAMFNPPRDPDYVLYSCAGDVDRRGCSIWDAVKVSEARNVEDIKPGAVPSDRIAVLWDEDQCEWCVWDGDSDKWVTVSGNDEHYHFSIKFREAV